MDRVSTFRATVLLLVVTFVLSACGTSAPSAPAANAPATAAPTDAPAAATVPAATTAAEAPTTAATTDATTAPAATTAAEAPTTAAATSGEPYVFGMVLVGPINDGGWNQANYEAGKYVESKLPGTKFIYIDKVNPGDRPNVSVEQVVDDLISQGAKFVITDSDDFKDGTLASAKAHPDVTFIHTSGDSVLTGQAPPNLGNIMGRMEYAKMIGGCAAALQTQTGKISYLGPLINDETRRLVNASYLGARHCWVDVLKKPASDLKFNVTWIGFWFNIPGVTLDPTQVANDFINSGSDVILSGLDTTEGLVEANKATQSGKKIYAVANDFKEGCTQAPAICLGSPYINWGPGYLKVISEAKAGTWKPSWDWLGPDWKDINNADTSSVGWVSGEALGQDNTLKLNDFIKGLADGSLNLYTGPIKFQDGTDYLKEGETLKLGDVEADKKVWYTPQLLEGIEGQSSPQ